MYRVQRTPRSRILLDPVASAEVGSSEDEVEQVREFEQREGALIRASWAAVMRRDWRGQSLCPGLGQDDWAPKTGMVVWRWAK